MARVEEDGHVVDNVRIYIGIGALVFVLGILLAMSLSGYASPVMGLLLLIAQVLPWLLGIGLIVTAVCHLFSSWKDDSLKRQYEEKGMLSNAEEHEREAERKRKLVPAFLIVGVVCIVMGLFMFLISAIFFS